MKCTTPEISWHNRDPVLSIDIQNGSYETSKGELFWRLATGGADSHVLIWHLFTCISSGATVKCVMDLERHQKAVNVVRFSPSKEILASGDDESVIMLWKRKENCEFFISLDDDENKEEQWVLWKVLKGHLEDVYDISWSPDSSSLISGSVDNTAILWDIYRGRSSGILSDSKGFVQGVSWDPRNQYICTISTDRQCRLVDIATKRTIQRVHKSVIPTPPNHPSKSKRIRLFYDDTFKSFFRRLTFSMDGTLIIVPSGIIEPRDTIEKISNATIVFSRHNLKEPIMVLPSLDECTIAIRCCPVYFKLRKDGPMPIITLPYRIVFAVATQQSVLIYDSQQISPIAVISNIHYTRLTDIAWLVKCGHIYTVDFAYNDNKELLHELVVISKWSTNGHVLVVSSTDGYCSIIHFSKNELGNEYDNVVDAAIIPVQLSLSNSNVNGEIAKDTNTTIVINTDDNDAMNVNEAKRKKKMYTGHDQCEKMYSRCDGKLENTMRSNCNSSERDLIRNQQLQSNSDEMDEQSEDIELVYIEESESDVKSSDKEIPFKASTTATTSTERTPRRVKLITLSSSKRKKK